jgi:hypothetical protein
MEKIYEVRWDEKIVNVVNEGKNMFYNVHVNI